LVFDASSEAGEMLVLDVDDRPLVVDARHAMSGAPTSVAIDGRRYDVVAWAGPWPVEERWWDPRRARRAVRLQLVVRPAGTGASSAALVAVLERRTWRLAAWYA